MFSNHLIFALKEKFHAVTAIHRNRLLRMLWSLFTEFPIYLFSCFNVLTFSFLFQIASYARKYNFSMNVLMFSVHRVYSGISIRPSPFVFNSFKPGVPFVGHRQTV